MFLALTSFGGNPSEAPDLILYNGKIVTEDPNFTIVQAVAIRKNKILATGSDKAIKKLAGRNTKFINLAGRTVIPGLTDSHAHPERASVSELFQEIPDVHSIDELLGWIKKQAVKKKKGEWIIHSLFFFTRLKELRQPTLAELDRAAPDNPVFLNGSYGGVINSAAMKASGINEQSTDPGILHDPESGALTGLIRSSAFKLLKKPSYHSVPDQEKKEALKKMLTLYNQYGITSICSGGGNYESYKMYRELNKSNQLTTRVFQNIVVSPPPNITVKDLEDSIRAFKYKTGDGDEMVRIGALKIVLDGGILTGTAYMREPWNQRASQVYGITDTAYRGLLNYSREDLLSIVKMANDRHWKFTAHCTGGGGVDLLLDVFEEVNRQKPIKNNRFSIIHANFFTIDAIKRMNALGVYADMQPAWFYKDGDAMEYLLGDKIIKSFHPYRSLFDGGVIVNGGSDHMVKMDANKSINPYNPFLAMWATITRTTERGNVIVPSEAITRNEALKMYTINNAYASFEENLKGTIEPGKLADMAVLTDDILICPANDIKNIKSELTLLGGKIVYSSGKIIPSTHADQQ